MTDPDGVSRRFDPRFSPAFQPGYDPRVHREEPRRDWNDLRSPQRPEPVAHPSFDLAEFGLGEPAEIESDEEAAAEPPPWWRRFNPWLVVLWVLGVAFILAGFWLINLVATVYGQDQLQLSGFESYLMSLLGQMVFFGAPMLVTLGLATLTSTVVILAARWKRP